MITGLIAFAVLLILVFLRLPLAYAMILVGFFGIFINNGLQAALAMIGQVTSTVAASAALAILPLFILMGNLITHSGLSQQLYAAANAFLGHRRGGLAMATIVASGGFSAISGSSIATAATMTKVACPPMRKYGYSDRLASGAVAAGGTLGILIPPSVVLVIYGTLTETSIGDLFIAAIIPGLIAILLYLLAVVVLTRVSPKAGPAMPRASTKERAVELFKVWPIVGLFLLVMGGIYTGVFTPSEAAGIGAGGALLITIAKRAITLPLFYKTLLETAVVTAMMFLVLIGATIFASYIDLIGMTSDFVSYIDASGLSPYAVLLMIMAVYIVLGCVFESLSMILLTVPVFYPVVAALGFDLLWFGVLVVVVTEIAMITPPIGLNLFTVKSVWPELKSDDLMIGIMPFLLADLLRLALLLAIPALTLYLPSLM